MTVRNKAENRRDATTSTRRGDKIHKNGLKQADRRYSMYLARQHRKSLTARRQSGRNFSSPGSANYLYHSNYVTPLNVTPVGGRSSRSSKTIRRNRRNRRI